MVKSNLVVKAYFAATTVAHMAGLSKQAQVASGIAAAFSARGGLHAVSRIPAYANPLMGLNLLPKEPARALAEGRSTDSRSPTRTLTNRRTSRGGRGATTLSQSARKSVRPGIGKKRRRCSSRSKSGKPCLRPRGHSGRHRYS